MTVGRRVAISILSQPVTALKSFDLGLSLCLPIEIESELNLKHRFSAIFKFTARLPSAGATPIAPKATVA